MAKVFKSYRKESNTDWGAFFEDGETPNREQLGLGCLLRIADATELMAKNYTLLQDAKDQYQRWYNNERAENAKLTKQISAYKGVITKLKKKLSASK